MKTIKLLSLHTGNPEVVSVEGIVLILVCMGDLGMCTWFGVLENLAVGVLLGDVLH